MSELITGLAGNRDAAAFQGTLELAMTASRSNQGAAVVGQQSEDLADLHAGDYARTLRGASVCGLTLKVIGGSG